jgi:phosphoribosylglycinamide formyltransferase 1
MTKIAVFASGSGTNAQRIAEFFNGHPSISVDIIFTNNKDAFVIERAKLLNIPYIIFNRKDFCENGSVMAELKNRRIDFIVLAGFLWLVPNDIIRAYQGRMVNIHPALLPAYGGKGMYGAFVHEAVVANKEKISGITIHLVNDHYDSGDIIFQARCEVSTSDTTDSLAAKIHALEYEHFPKIIEEVIRKNQVSGTGTK